MRSPVIVFAVVALAVCAEELTFSGSYFYRWLTRVPPTRDSRLVGTWKGSVTSWAGDRQVTMTTILGKDGRGRVLIDGAEKFGGFDWGTENRVFHTRRMATDAWAGSACRYSLSSDANALSFSPTKLPYLVAPEMTRQ